MDIYLAESQDQYTTDESQENVNVIASEAYVYLENEMKKASVVGFEDRYTDLVVIDQETGDIIKGVL